MIFKFCVMNKIGVLKSFALLLIFAQFGLQSCGIIGGLFGGGNGFDDNGELVGAPGREGWEMSRPF
jgi:formylglycine-generating enzyme